MSVAAFFSHRTDIRRVGALLLVCALPLACPASGANGWRTWHGGSTPSLSLNDLEGKPRSLKEFRGRVLIVNFWATWCEPCVEEMPALQRLADQYGADGLDVVGVNLGEGASRIEGFMNKTGTRFPVMLDRDGDAKRAWKVNGVPATFLIGRDGKVKRIAVGQLDFSNSPVLQPITQLLKRRDATPGGNPRSGVQP